MKRSTALLAGTAFLAITAGAASADCAEELAQLTGGGAAGEISKDGSLAPLDGAGGSSDATGAGTSGTATTGTAAPAGAGAAGSSGTAGDTGEIVKDGSTAPLETEAGSGEPTSGGSTAIATSPQAVEAQQDGAASTGDVDPELLQQARMALEAGDEERCMELIEQARR